MSEKLASDDIRVLSHKLQISVIKSLLQPMLRRGNVMRSPRRDLEGSFVFPWRTMAENYHLKDTRKGKKTEKLSKLKTRTGKLEMRRPVC